MFKIFDMILELNKLISLTDIFIIVETEFMLVKISLFLPHQ